MILSITSRETIAQLWHHMQQCYGRSAVPLEDRLEDLVAERECMEPLSELLRIHRPPPIVTSKSSLPHKIHAMLWGLRHCVGSLRQLDQLCRCCISIATDMGVEAGLSDFYNMDVCRIMPTWLVAGRRQVDVDGDRAC